MLKKSLFVALCAGLAVTVFAATPQSVEDALMQTTGLKADAVQKSPVPGMWEVVVQDRVFYVALRQPDRYGQADEPYE